MNSRNSTTCVVLLLVLAILATPFATLAQDYEREAKERPLRATAVIDEANGIVNILIHSDPTPWAYVEGIKNPVMAVRVLSVAIEKTPYITAKARNGSYTVEVRAASSMGETNEQMRIRLQGCANGDPDMAKIDLSTAEYNYDRQLTISVVLTRYRGYDDELELMYDEKGNLRNWYIEERKLRLVLPEHRCRLHWTTEGQPEESVSGWMDSGSSYDLRRLLQRSGMRAQVEIEGRKVPNQIAIYAANRGPLWTGKLVDFGQAIEQAM